MYKFSLLRKANFVFVFCIATIASYGQTFTSLANFDGTDGANPYSSLIQGSDGNFYGTTNEGGDGNHCTTSGGCGTVFSITSAGQLTTIYSFCSLQNCSDGTTPYSALAQAGDGSFYGTTYAGGGNSSCPVIVAPSSRSFREVR